MEELAFPLLAILKESRNADIFVVSDFEEKCWHICCHWILTKEMLWFQLSAKNKNNQKENVDIQFVIKIFNSENQRSWQQQISRRSPRENNANKKAVLVKI